MYIFMKSVVVFEGQKGLGILNIEKYSTMFGIGQKTGVDVPDEVSGVIPSPEWKIKNFNGDPWRVGNTYHTAIGQYGYQVTLMQMVRATSAIANKGTLLTPHFILSDLDMQKKNISIDYINNEYYQIIHEGMEQAVKDGGTAIALNVPYVKVAAKTGTAQLGVTKDRVNSWVIGFFPYDHPKYAFTLMMESGPKSNGIGASAVMREVLDYMNQNTPEYFE
jgi:penicillin-binding protein 2